MKKILMTVFLLTIFMVVVPNVRALEVDGKTFVDFEWANDNYTGKVFDYSIDGNTLLIKINDYDVYKALLDGKTVYAGTELFDKFKKEFGENSITFNLTHNMFLDNVVKVTSGDVTYDKEEFPDGLGVNFPLVYYHTANGDIKEHYTVNYVYDEKSVALKPESTSEYIGYDADGNEVYRITFTKKYVLNETSVEDTNNGVAVVGKKDIDSTLTVEKLDTNSDVYKELVKKLESSKVLGSYEVKLNGNYEGKLSVSFNVDNTYNGQNVTVLHKKSDGTIETFAKVVTDGKVTVEVDELSPFVIALGDVKVDSTPTLGVPSYVGLASLIVLCASVCLVKVLKKD